MDSLQLYDTVWKKVRIGRPYDGGYVIAELPGEYDGFISGGIASDISFEKAWLDKFQHDRCIAFDGTIPCLPEYDSRIAFVKKNIGCEENDTHTNLHLWMEPHSNLFMKIDIEGHEFRVFPTFTETQWNKIKQLVVEIHTPGDIQLHPSYFNGLSDITHDVMFNMLKTINRTHTLIHVHPNNGCKTHVVDGITLPNVFECTYIRNDYVEERVHNTQPLPFSIDMPNLPDKPVVPFTGYPFVSTSRKQKQYRIAIIGPGIMPIPPPGWGACEILIWDYACELRKLGHIVDIINTKDSNEMIHSIQQMKPDIVHIQYDDHAHIVPHIFQHTKLVALTSHFGYLEQHNRWGGYERVFSNMISPLYPNYYHFVLSEGISRVYQYHGIDSKKIYVTPNGARSDQFRYTKTPLYPNRSIIVGKIEPRKRQSELQHNMDVWFAGNRIDSNFNEFHPRWLGEWSKDTLYHNLTDYGNLVLLSDGEADPLVVKEALIAGLGVVVSQWAAANLDTSLPFITVIPVDKLDDRLYVDECVKTNREISNAMRSEIKEYSARFDWSVLVGKYIEIIDDII
jgi:glycosyltransferase involved in cell wall biosynthesis